MIFTVTEGLAQKTIIKNKGLTRVVMDLGFWHENLVLELKIGSY